MTGDGNGNLGGARRARHPGWTPIGVTIGGAVLCGLAILLGWGVVPWIVGAVVMGLGLLTLGRRSGRVPVTVGAAVVLVLAVGLPFVLPYLDARIPVAWSAPGEQVLTSSDEVIVTIGHGDDDDGDADVVRARVAGTGGEMWSHRIGDEDPVAWTHRRAGVVVARVEVRLGEEWEFRAFDVRNGAELWSFPAGSSSHPVATAGESFVFELGDAIEVRDARSGEVRWTEPADLRDPVRPPLGPHALPEVAYVGIDPPEGDPGSGTRHHVIRVVDADSGEAQPAIEVSPGSLASVVGDVLVVDNTHAKGVRPEVGGAPEYRTVTLTGYALPSGSPSWSVDLERPTAYDVERLGVVPRGLEHVFTITPDGAVEAVTIAGGNRTVIEPPPGRSFAVDPRASMRIVPRGLVLPGGEDGDAADTFVDLDAGTATAVRAVRSAPSAGYPGDADRRPAALWRISERDVFDRPVPRVSVLDPDRPQLRDVGRLPGGASGLEVHAGMLTVRADDELVVLSM